MPDQAVGWQVASAAFFLYAIGVAWALPGLPPPARRRAAGVSAAGLMLTAGTPAVASLPALHDWVIPPVLLLLGYWASGALFVGPMFGAERVLEATDRWLGMPALAMRTPRLLAEYLELAYLAVYPLIPIALVVRVFYLPDANPDHFWTVVLVTDFICFAVLPWVQTRPPRALEPRDPWRSSIRGLNLRLLGVASIQVNTFPSGHAAEAMAAALLVAGAPPLVVAGMFVMAVSVSAGAVLGRYHYALDAIAGWAVAVGVWWMFHP